MSIEAMKQALEALESGDWYIDQLEMIVLEMIVYYADDTGTHEERAKVQAAITALRAAIAKAENHGPIAWIYTDAKGRDVIIGTNTAPYEDAIPLYTHPPRRECMPDDLIMTYEKGFSDGKAKLKEKNT